MTDIQITWRISRATEHALIEAFVDGAHLGYPDFGPTLLATIERDGYVGDEWDVLEDWGVDLFREIPAQVRKEAWGTWA